MAARKLIFACCVLSSLAAVVPAALAAEKPATPPAAADAAPAGKHPAPTSGPAEPAAAWPWEPAGTPKQAVKMARVLLFIYRTVPVESVFYADDEQSRKFLAAISGRGGAAQRLAAAVRECLGGDAVAAVKLGPIPSYAEAEKDMRSGGDAGFDEVNAATETVKGDRATVQFSTEVGGELIHARKIGGGWRVNFHDIDGELEAHGMIGPDYKEPQATLEMLRLEAEIDDGLAKEVRAGKFASGNELAKVAKADSRKSRRSCKTTSASGPEAGRSPGRHRPCTGRCGQYRSGGTIARAQCKGSPPATSAGEETFSTGDSPAIGIPHSTG